MNCLRLEYLESRLTPATPADLLVQPAGEFNWLQATPDGGLIELVFKGNQLTSRTRVGNTWIDEDVLPNDSALPPGSPVFREDIERTTRMAQLLVTPDSTAHVFVPSFAPGASPGEAVLALDHYTHVDGGNWEFEESVAVSGPLGVQSPENIDNVTGAVAADGSIHLIAAMRSALTNGAIRYATNKSGSWQFETVPAPLEPVFILNSGANYSTRYFSVAVDSANAVHIAYTPRFEQENFGRVFSQLIYATNRGGNWGVEPIFAPPDGTGDAGLASSIAVGPGDQVAVASYFVDRVTTGSPASAQLLFHRRTDRGWQAQTVAAQSDGYSAADGPQYTGFSPLLQFDGGVPVITFSDIAAEHIGGSAREYSGQIRTATLSPGGWQLATVFRQANPLANLMLYPVRTVVAGTPVYGGLVASYELDGNRLISDFSGTYQLLELNAPFIAPKGPEAGTPGGKLGAGIVGADAGGGPVVQSYDSTGTRTLQVLAFDAPFTGGVRVAAADFNGDGAVDIVAGTGPGIATRVRILDGVDGRELHSIDPFESSFTGGVYVVAGDLSGDGVPDFVITPDEGGGPRVDIYDGKSFQKLASFFGIDDPNFRGGARAAIGDLSGDGRLDLIVAAGFGGGPRVAAFDGKSLASGLPANLFGDFFAFEESLRNGIFVTSADLDGDGFAELVAGGGPGGGPRITAFAGKSLLANRYVTPVNFFAGSESNRGGVRLAARDVDGDGLVDLLAGSGAAAGSRVTAYRSLNLIAGDTAPSRDFDAFLGFGGGVFVG